MMGVFAVHCIIANSALTPSLVVLTIAHTIANSTLTSVACDSYHLLVGLHRSLIYHSAHCDPHMRWAPWVETRLVFPRWVP